MFYCFCCWNRIWLTKKNDGKLICICVNSAKTFKRQIKWINTMTLHLSLLLLTTTTTTTTTPCYSLLSVYDIGVAGGALLYIVLLITSFMLDCAFIVFQIKTIFFNAEFFYFFRLVDRFLGCVYSFHTSTLRLDVFMHRFLFRIKRNSLTQNNRVLWYFFVCLNTWKCHKLHFNLTSEHLQLLT